MGSVAPASLVTYQYDRVPLIEKILAKMGASLGDFAPTKDIVDSSQAIWKLNA
jgi:hypothetical protein